MRKIICIVIVAISLITVCFASDNLYSVEDFTIDNSIELPEFISTTVASLPETDSFLILKFTDTQYIGYNRIDYTYYSGAFLMITSSTNVNWSSYDGVCSYELAYIVNHKGSVKGDASTGTSYTFDPSKAIIVNYRNFNVDGEVFTSIDDYTAQKEEKEYKSGVLGWFQKLFDSITVGFDNLVNSIGMFFNPCHEDFEVDFGTFIDNSIKNNFGFIESFKTAFDNFGNMNEPLVIEEDVTIGSKSYIFRIDLSFYEAYRLKIRSGISSIFYVACFLCCFNMLKRVVGVQFGGSSNEGQSHDSNKGG